MDRVGQRARENNTERERRSKRVGEDDGSIKYCREVDGSAEHSCHGYAFNRYPNWAPRPLRIGLPERETRGSFVQQGGQLGRQTLEVCCGSRSDCLMPSCGANFKVQDTREDWPFWLIDPFGMPLTSIWLGSCGFGYYKCRHCRIQAVTRYRPIRPGISYLICIRTRCRCRCRCWGSSDTSTITC